MAAQSRPKKYANRNIRDIDFKVEEQVFLKVSPMKEFMRFGKRGKLSPWNISYFEILKNVGPIVD